MLLDKGPDALLARIHLIRSARRSIDLQTYIFAEDDSAQLVLDELQAAAFRGVKVRLLLDQLSALEKVSTLAALSGLHANFELRLYNPVLDRARLSRRCMRWPRPVAGGRSTGACTPSCCWWTTRSPSPAGAITRTTISIGMRPTTSAIATCSSRGR